MASHPIATGDLCDFTIGEGVALQRAQHKKAMDQALSV
jgi:hypothetical protein